MGDRGGGSLPEVEKTVNRGVGMIALVAPDSGDTALARLAARGVDAWVLGQARERRDGETGDAAHEGPDAGSDVIVGSRGAREEPRRTGEHDIRVETLRHRADDHRHRQRVARGCRVAARRKAQKGGEGEDRAAPWRPAYRLSLIHISEPTRPY